MTSADLGYNALQQKTLIELGLTPKLITQPHIWDGRYGAAPTSSSSGLDTTGAARIKAGVTLRKTPGRQRAALRVDTAQAGDTIGFVVGSHGLDTVTGYDSAPDAAAALKAALEADATFTDDLGGTASIPTNKTNAILIEIDGLESITVGGAVQGAARVAAWAEASWCLWRVWGRLRGTDLWCPLPGVPAQYTTEDVGLVDCGAAAAGCDRIAIQVIAADGLVVAWVAPGGRDDQATEITEATAANLEEREGKLYDFPLATATNPPQGTQANALLLSSAQIAAIGSERPVGLGRIITTQGRVTLTDAGGTVLAANPRRRGFFCRNLSGADPYYRATKTASVSAATTNDLPVKPDEIDTDSGPDCPHGAILGITDTGKSVVVWREEWE